jgi:YidC/Oxa1 family membrane protein insertase
MELLINIFNEVLYRPLFNLLVLIYEYFPLQDFGIAVILLTVLIKVFLYPLGKQSIRVQKVVNELQPKIQEIQKKYKDNKAEQARLTIELYKKEKINPFAGILPLLIQIPILIALYQLFWKGIQADGATRLYSFVSISGPIDPTFLGGINLSNPNLALAIFAGVSQFWQVKLASPKLPKPANRNQFPQFSAIMQKQMLYFFPVFTIFILLKIPSAVALYWAVSTLFTIGQQYLGAREKGNS